METKEITITLADGNQVKFAGINGTNYVVPNQEAMDVSVFTDDNLTSGSITDENGNVETFKNWAFIQQQKQLNGDYYVCFRQKSAQEVADAERDAYIATLEDALLELYESQI